MSVSGNADVRLESQRNTGLPQHVQRFRAAGRATGDVSAGDANVNLRTNPASLSAFQPYIALYRVLIVGSVADPTDGYLAQPVGDWEETSGLSTAARWGQLITVALNGLWIAEWTGPVYLGRIEKGSAGRIQATFPNVNTAVYDVFFYGVQSDRPFVAEDSVRV